MIKDFKDKLRDLKIYIEWDKKTIDIKRNKWNKKWKKWSKKKMNILDDEINNILEKFDVNLSTWCIFLGKPYNFERERELRLSTKGKIK